MAHRRQVLDGDPDRFVELTATDGTPLAMRRWKAERRRAVLFYVHGIQSHSGWLFETGPFMAARGVEVYALDRRGSGISGGARGHLPSAEAVLDDYSLAMESVQELSEGCPITALGQSLGGSVLAALCSTRPVVFSRLVFSAPALGQQRHRNTLSGLSRLRLLTGTELSPVQLEDRQYTDVPRFLDFMATDPLMLREITQQTRATLVALEDLYWAFMESDRLDVPVAFLTPGEDRIIDLEQARKTMLKLAPHAVEKQFPTSSHYLEFSDARLAFWQWVHGFTAKGCDG